ncbi:MAG: hypothetical protein CM15mP112_02370 [Flavobacteriales bacterium]|nr:MAG: hypothetical protein CM15mP112_02370 [Flavobacteriales bacterium]
MRIIFFASIFVSTILYSQQKNIIDNNNLNKENGIKCIKMAH